jgi:hypothetical protein
MLERSHTHLGRTLIWFVTMLVLSVSGSAFAQHLNPTQVQCTECQDRQPEMVMAVLEVSRQELPGLLWLGFVPAPTVAPVPAHLFAAFEVQLGPVLPKFEWISQSNPRAPPVLLG